MDQFANAAAAIQASVDQNNAWSAQQAQKQMDFQREMSNTAHQREIADLKASGLNPVLSAKLGGASTPSGAMASGDTSGTSALVDLLGLAMQTANSAASAAASSSGVLRSGSDNSAKTESDDTVITNDTIKDVTKVLPRGFLKTFLEIYLATSKAVGNDGIHVGKSNDAGLSSRYGSSGDSKSLKDVGEDIANIYNSAKDKIAAFNRGIYNGIKGYKYPGSSNYAHESSNRVLNSTGDRKSSGVAHVAKQSQYKN